MVWELKVAYFDPFFKLSLHKIVWLEIRVQRNFLGKLRESNGLCQVIFSLKKKWLSFLKGLRPIAASIKEGFLVLRLTIVLGQKVENCSVGSLEELEDKKKYSEIFWPLVQKEISHASQIWNL